jgi:dTDP-4-amino-4,6-dideoxygalactose transaminase
MIWNPGCENLLNGGLQMELINMNKMNIPLIKPYINEEIKARVAEVLDSGYLTEGPVTHEFEEAFRKFIGSRHAIAVTSCTTGLEVALRCLGIGPGDEVIVPDYTYPATAAVVSIVGAHCVIVDIDPSTLLIRYDAIESAITRKTKAIIPVSLFGNPLDYNRLNDIKARHNLYIIEDAACAIGAQFEGRMVGTDADITVFSLHPRKFITTGEGGMITTNRNEWAEWMNSYKHFGMDASGSRESIHFGMVGTNYKLSNVLSAIGLGQLKDIDNLLHRRRKLADNYSQLFAGQNGIVIPSVTPGGVHSYQSYCLLVDDRDRIMHIMRQGGIEVQIGTYSLHVHDAFKNKTDFTCLGDLSGSKLAFSQCLTLPLYHDLSMEQQQDIANKLKSLFLKG